MRRLSALLIALFLLLPAAPAEAARRRTVQRSAEAFLPTAQADALAGSALAAGTPGISIAVANRGAIFARGYGHATPARDAAVDTDTIFQIASLTKQFTAAAILALEEDGRLSVSDPVARWIPELDLGGRTVTLHHLLTHTSGLRTGTEFLVDLYAPVAEAEMNEGGRRGRPPVPNGGAVRQWLQPQGPWPWTAPAVAAAGFPPRSSIATAEGK